MNAEKQRILDLLYDDPIQIGHWVGFKDLTVMHNDWLKDFLYGQEDQTLQGHRGSYKTTTLSIFLALHSIIFPNKTVLFFRKTGNDVAEVMRQTSKILNAGCVRQIVSTLRGKPLVLVKDTNFEISTNLSTSIRGSAQIVGLGIGTSITGKHADVIVTDDIVNINDRLSQAERERTKIAYQELQNIKNRGGRFINTGTPWHKDDAFTLMPNPKRYPWDVTGLITPEEAKDIKSHMTNSLFAANYELKHVADDDVIFDDPEVGADAHLVEQGTSHVDAAFYGEDYTAWGVMTKHDGKYYLYGKCKRKHVEDCYSAIMADYTRFRGGKLYNESNADKGFVAKDLRKLGAKVILYTEKENKYIKIVTHLKAIWNDLYFVDGTDQEYISQICNYFEDAEHDDAPDDAACLARIFYPKKEGTYQSIYM
jgi:hypothetical protein